MCWVYFIQFMLIHQRNHLFRIFIECETRRYRKRQGERERERERKWSRLPLWRWVAPLVNMRRKRPPIVPLLEYSLSYLILLSLLKCAFASLFFFFSIYVDSLLRGTFCKATYSHWFGKMQCCLNGTCKHCLIDCCIFSRQI